MVVIRIGAEEMQNALLQEIDGALAEVSEIYTNSYEPGVKRIEVTLVHEIEHNGETIKVVPGLYEDNIEPANGPARKTEKSQLRESAITRFKRWERQYC